jgi:RNA polymerase sigma-70 factor, ECF subfamily
MTARVLPLKIEPRESSKLSDEALALACGSADPAVVAELFLRYHHAVARYLSRLVHHPSDVEDLLQATFLEIARGRAQYSARSKVQTWLFGIATNLTRIFWRSVRRRRRLERELTLVETHTMNEYSTSLMESHDSLQCARLALDMLPESQREAFVLCEIEGLTAREAAEVLQTSETAVWKRVSYARQTILHSSKKGQDS